MSGNYVFRFHTSIFLVSRKVYREASNIFYMENLFIRINHVLPGPFFQYVNQGYGLPIFWDGSKVMACTRHALEIDLIPNSMSSDQRTNQHFIVACDDLPRIVRQLLWDAANREIQALKLLDVELWAFVGDEIGTIEVESMISNASTGEKRGNYLSAATKTAVANRNNSGLTKRSGFTVERATNVGAAISSTSESALFKGSLEVTSDVPSLRDNLRLRRLLEPLRALYNVGAFHIDAPISERYREEIKVSLFRRELSINDIFPMLLSAYEEAVATFEAGSLILAEQMMSETLCIMSDIKDNFAARALKKVTTGPFGELSLAQTLYKMHYVMCRNKLRTYLTLPEAFWEARSVSTPMETVMMEYVGNDAWDENPHEKAMACYLGAEVWEMRDRRGEFRGHCRTERLAEVISVLEKAVSFESDNAMVQRELKRRGDEETKARREEEARRMEIIEGETLARWAEETRKVERIEGEKMARRAARERRRSLLR